MCIGEEIVAKLWGARIKPGAALDFRLFLVCRPIYFARPIKSLVLASQPYPDHPFPRATDGVSHAMNLLAN